MEKVFKSLILKGLNGRWNFQKEIIRNEKWDKVWKKIKVLREQGSPWKSKGFRIKGFSKVG